jgi:hypothetical protein
MCLHLDKAVQKRPLKIRLNELADYCEAKEAQAYERGMGAQVEGDRVAGEIEDWLNFQN